MEFIINKIAAELKIKPIQVQKTVEMIDEGNTIPFIARYRKEIHGGLDDEILRNLDERLKYLRNLESRKEEVIRLIDEQGKLTDELVNEIKSAQVLQRVEDLYRPYKQKKSTRASKAKERGLEPLAVLITSFLFAGNIEKEAEKFINEEKDVLTAKDAIDGAKDIIAESVSDNANYRAWIKKFIYQNGKIISEAVNKKEKTVYDMYYEYDERIKTIANHRVLAVNRGEKEGILKVKLAYDEDSVVNYIIENEIVKENDVTNSIYIDAAKDAFKRLISISIEREIRSNLTEVAEEDAIKVFGKNTKPLLMHPPIKGAKVLGVDPSFRTGCKLAIIDEFGKFIDYATIYPNQPQNEIEKSKKVIKEIIKKYDIDLIAIGNGTASRETESLVANILSEIDKDVSYAIVSEAGASVYSASKLATEEFPDINVSIRGAISIGRRLQDPLAELVKIDPKSIGVGQYQHDVNQKKLEESLTNVVEDCVNAVGVDLNTASVSLLSYVSGISKSIAKNIVDYRENTKNFGLRKELLKVKRLGNKAYEQCAGFLRISESENPLDNTGVHPESYGITEKLLNELGYDLDDVKNHNLNEIVDKTEGRYKELSDKLGVGILTLKDIVKELHKPGRDPRDDMPKPVFRKDIVKFEDLSEGMILTGTVRNVVNFGAFVDIGIKNDGLVHISQLSDKFVKNPMDVVKVGDIVTVKIIKIDIDRHKVSLS
ncbi:MAG: RNA-binding transcriptional accessory protein, partial [Clostridiales bacterium]|nr:RNA-binding transcriptional accessory protein [Clostridiales bacterium]